MHIPFRACILRVEDNCPIQDGGEFVNPERNRLLGDLVQISEQLNDSMLNALPDVYV